MNLSAKALICGKYSGNNLALRYVLYCSLTAIVNSPANGGGGRTIGSQSKGTFGVLQKVRKRHFKTFFLGEHVFRL